MEENHKDAALAVDQLIQKWSRSEAAEQKNMPLFLTELCLRVSRMLVPSIVKIGGYQAKINPK